MKLFIIIIFILTQKSFADTFSLYAIKSPTGIDWNSPWTITATTLRNSLFQFKDKRTFSIGHVFVELKCEETNTHILRGMTTSGETQERDLVLKEKYGLGVLIHNFDGLLEKDEVVTKALIPYYHSPRINKITFEINKNACARMLKFATEFEERGYGKKYSGFHADPFKGEGAGCSAFAMSFLEVAGLIHSEFKKEWGVNVRIPMKLIGGPRTNRHVKIQNILTKPNLKWAKENEEHFRIFAWEPQKIHSWISKSYKKIQTGIYDGVDGLQIGKDKNFKEVILDLSSIEAPESEIWEEPLN